MKKVICMLLLVVLCFSLCVTALAEGVQSPGPVAPTGDESPVIQWIVLMIVALAALVTTVILYRKNDKKESN